MLYLHLSRSLLTHRRFAAVNLNKERNEPSFLKVVEALEEDDKLRTDFFKACLRKIGLQVNETEQSVPSLSRLHLSSILPTETELLFVDLEGLITRENGKEYIKGVHDTFQLEKPSSFSTNKLTESLSSETPPSTAENANEGPSDGILDYDEVVKRIVVHWDGVPAAKETPYFNHAAYFSNFAQYVRDTNGTEGWFGKHILYGEVVTSTSTMLEK